MNDDTERLVEPRPLQLTRLQEDVLKALGGAENERHPLSQWYLGALYALQNNHNPDRISQAAHSLRELVEKLPRVLVGSGSSGSTYNIPEHRRLIAQRIANDRVRYTTGWEGSTIDSVLGKTIEAVATYFDQSQQPSRREQVESTFVAADPLANSLDARILNTKRDVVHNVWRQLEAFVHHGSVPNEQDFLNCLAVLERTILDLLAPITAQDQYQIRSILAQTERTDADIALLFTLVERRGANYKFFLTEASDPVWISILSERGYFSNPPHIVGIDGEQHTPYWWPMDYLRRAASSAPDAVVEVILRLPSVDNPMIQQRILDIACQLPGLQSTRLKSQALQIAEGDIRFLGHGLSDLLTHWVAQDQLSSALELAALTIRFERDSQITWNNTDRPLPKLEDWQYRKLFESAILPMAHGQPYEVALMLVNVTEEMLALRWGEQSPRRESGEDLSEIWCRRLDRVDDRFDEASNVLVQGLSVACETVFEQNPGAIATLDHLLRQHKWKLFRRLRQHLYSKFPNEETRNWIRAFLLDTDHYAHERHHYEFQRMARHACEALGEELLSIEERRSIFDTILSGPPPQRFLKKANEHGNTELLARRRRYFHWAQLRPFAAVLFGKYSIYYEELQRESDEDLSDDDYLPVGDTKSGAITMQSPRTVKELSGLGDSQLLDFINEWKEEYEYQSGLSGDGWLIEVNVTGLADALKTVFQESILIDTNRLSFWIEHLPLVEQTVYVEAFVKAMEEYVRSGNFDRLDESFAVCEWVLSHLEERDNENIPENDQSHYTPQWRNPRRATADFIEACLEKDSLPFASAREGLYRLLEVLCTQSDWRLDHNRPVRIDRFEPFDEAINSTRSRALRSLVKYGLLAKRQGFDADISFVLRILEQRFLPSASLPLTLPEYAILGVHYANFLHFDADWTVGHAEDFFPQHAWDCWYASFGSLLQFTHCQRHVFDTLREQFEFAVENLPDIKGDDDNRAMLTGQLGEHLFIYFLWGVYPLGNGSILERFFHKTARQRAQWGILFRRVGLILHNADAIEDDRKERVKEFFEWRLRQGEAKEMEEFGFWFESDILEPEWRLHALTRALDIGQPDAFAIYGIMKTLNEMLGGFSEEVVVCFAKLVNNVENNLYSIETEIAKRILKAGMDSPDEDVRSEAHSAHEYLLKRGRSDLLDLDG